MLWFAVVLAYIVVHLSKNAWNYLAFAEFSAAMGGAILSFLVGYYVNTIPIPRKEVIIGELVFPSFVAFVVLGSENEIVRNIAATILGLVVSSVFTLADRYDREQEKTEEAKNTEKTEETNETDLKQFKKLCIEDKLGLIEQCEKELNKGDQKDGNTYIVTVKKES